jgi:hypothetical protein
MRGIIDRFAISGNQNIVIAGRLTDFWVICPSGRSVESAQKIAFTPSLRGALATKQSILCLVGWIASLRSQ